MSANFIRPELTSTIRKAVLFVAAMCLVLGGILALTAVHHPARMDYIEYWSSGKLIASHLDPYSPSGILALEKSAGFSAAKPLIMLNPPWTLFLVAPLGFLGVREGLFLWLLVTILCIPVSVVLLNRYTKNGPLALIFAPVLVCIFSGQSSPFLLLGFALFLHFERDRPWIAGASLLLMAIKPHLFLIFWAVLLMDCIYRRRFTILVWLATAVTAASTLSLCFDTKIWQHYITTLRGYHVQQGFIPTASMLLRMLIAPRAFWLLFVPSLIAILWGVWYYSRWKQVWDWRVHGMLLMLVTILASPYGFFSDEIVLLPSIAFGLTFVHRRKYSGWVLLVINTAAIAVVASGKQLSSPWYVWTPFAWLGWFVYATQGLPLNQGRATQDHSKMRKEAMIG